jgi:hypothetical protein
VITKNLSIIQNRTIRITDERWQHIIEHPEMLEQRDKLIETIIAPSVVIESSKIKAFMPITVSMNVHL